MNEARRCCQHLRKEHSLIPLLIGFIFDQLVDGRDHVSICLGQAAFAMQLPQKQPHPLRPVLGSLGNCSNPALSKADAPETLTCGHLWLFYCQSWEPCVLIVWKTRSGPARNRGSDPAEKTNNVPATNKLATYIQHMHIAYIHGILYCSAAASVCGWA